MEGKISVKHFLKKNLKPLVEGRTKKYPLYVRIRLDNKKAEFKSEYWEYLNADNFEKMTEHLTRVSSNSSRELKDSSLVEVSEENVYVSEDELTQQEFLSKLSKEAEVVREVISIYRDIGINIIEHNPKLTIDIAKTEIVEAVFQDMKGILMEKLTDNDYTAMYKLIDWRIPFCDIIKALREASYDKENPTQFYKDVLIEFDLNSIDSLLNFTLPNNRPRIYQWGNESLKNSLKKHLLSSTSKTSTDKLLRQIDSIFNEKIKNWHRK